jgi:hypothetical protein
MSHVLCFYRRCYFTGSKQNISLHLLNRIEGYEDMSLVSLIKAVDNLENLVPKIKRNAWIAKERSTNPSDGLTSEESAAIQLYTMEWKPGHPSLYEKLNASLRDKNRNQLIPYFSYLKLFLTALWKLESSKKIVWRGVRADLNAQYPVGGTVVWWGFR